MGVTGYLLSRKKLDGASTPKNEAILYEVKIWIPFAWNLPFRATDATTVKGDLVLAARSDAAVALARSRIPKLKPHVTPRLARILDQFVTSIEKAATSWLVLDPYRIEIDKEELIAPQRFFEKPSAKTFDHLVFDSDGLAVSKAGRLDVDDHNHIAGWTVEGDDPPWFPEGD